MSPNSITNHQGWAHTANKEPGSKCLSAWAAEAWTANITVNVITSHNIFISYHKMLYKGNLTETPESAQFNINCQQQSRQVGHLDKWREKSGLRDLRESLLIS